MSGDDWKTVLLQDLAADITVGFVGPMASEYVPEGIPFLRSQDIEPYRVNLSDIKFISREFHQKLRKSTLQPGDVVIVRTGKPGTASVIPEDLPVSNCSDVVIVRPGPQLDSRYLAYYINSSAVHHVSAHLVGAVQQHFNVGSARTLKLHLPPLPEQRAIARILGALDDKIELNRRQNATLEELARAIFKSWFVDFDPVRARAEGRAPAAMDAATAALFPDGFEERDGREVPRGWRVASLDSIASFLNGLALQKFPPQGEDYLPVIKIAQMRKDGVEGADKASTDIPAAYVIQDGDVLFSWSGSLEVMIWCGGRGALNQHLFKVSSNQFPRWFYYLWTRHHLPDFQAIAASKVTTMGHIQRHHLTEAMVILPSDGVLTAADKLVRPLVDKSVQNKLQSRTLAALRDALLPRLLSGELRVREAERLVADMAV